MTEALKRRRGRPRVDPGHPSVMVSVRLSAKDYDALYQAAQRERSTVADAMRRRLRVPDDPQPRTG